MPEILLCGSEGEPFLFENTLDNFGQSTKRRGSVTLSGSDQMFKQFDAPVSNMWVHARLAPRDFVITGTTRGTMIQISSADGGLARIYSSNNSSNPINFRYDVASDNAGTFTEGDSFPHAIDNLFEYDINVTISTTTVANDTLTVSFYRASVLRTRETIVGGPFSLPDRVLFAPRTTNVDEGEISYQDIIVTDNVPTVGMELATLVPDAVGNYSEFSGTYADIISEGYDSADVITTATIDQRESWTYATPGFTIGEKVLYGVAVTMVAQTDVGGNVNDFESFFRIGATDYDGGGVGADNIAPAGYTTFFTTNPSTSAPWELAELSTLETGIHSI